MKVQLDNGRHFMIDDSDDTFTLRDLRRGERRDATRRAVNRAMDLHALRHRDSGDCDKLLKRF